MSIQPQGEDLRKAVKWIAAERKFNPDKDIGLLIREACARFDLSPLDAEFLDRFIREKKLSDL
ncbi:MULTISPECIES: hypothetical protein [Desulfococcus]|jgi:hypothetical protein|uniref:Uncharacterized protein n=1 Tax=Desulfococcus multivorans DSM 2059 TaxID=1121405 RepID=S7TXK5_DESML|nr:hypothetical protein [Desulfococcus multivorans]AOY57082.1 conserved uncharacterized protein [Desulfococcus multivorans]AQU99592.2 hypothetical protein B2D07_01525 [Desulfococcus multivorans]EPR41791.1 hypothetical protein dsmv_0091 [Desulfococcus multivorans DSM 2059]MDX9818086.1 hypothetical protein [Desulfococcus multivorans]SJZ87990.1 hypothetical protein SAMN02745446_01942 [Desulfococcus multivorans DSM 2059]